MNDKKYIVSPCFIYFKDVNGVFDYEFGTLEEAKDFIFDIEKKFFTDLEEVNATASSYYTFLHDRGKIHELKKHEDIAFFCVYEMDENGGQVVFEDDRYFLVTHEVIN